MKGVFGGSVGSRGRVTAGAGARAGRVVGARSGDMEGRQAGRQAGRTACLPPPRDVGPGGVTGVGGRR